MDRLILLTSAHCHLCVDARAAMDRVSRQSGIPWREIDVAEDPEAAREYGDRLPVVLLDGREHGYWKVEETRLLADLGIDGG